MNLYVGIDPGKTGAVALIDSGARVLDLEEGELNTSTFIRSVGLEYNAVFIALERPDGRPGKGVSEFTLFAGRAIGRIEGALWAEGHRTLPILVGAPVWKARLGLGRDKHASLAKARALYPDVSSRLTRVKDHNRAEALLIAHYLKTCVVGDPHV